MLTGLVPQGDQPTQVLRDVVGLADVEREGGAGQGLAEQVPAQEGGGAAGPGDDLQDLGQDLVLQLGQGVGDRGGLLGVAGGGGGQPVRPPSWSSSWPPRPHAPSASSRGRAAERQAGRR